MVTVRKPWQPWAGRFLFALLGAALSGPAWQPAWESWQAHRDQQVQWEALAQNVQELKQTLKSPSVSSSPVLGLATPQAVHVQLKEKASAQGQTWSWWEMDVPTPVRAMWLCPFELRATAAVLPWMRWLQDAFREHEGSVLTHLHIQVWPTDEASLRLSWRVPCRVDAQQALDHTDDPFRLSSWQSLHDARVQTLPRSLERTARWSQARTTLERFTLDQAHYVGRLFDANQTIAIVQIRGPSSEVTHYSVKVGQAMGANLGTVTRVDAQALEVQEWLRDASGQWRSRRVQLLWEGP